MQSGRSSKRFRKNLVLFPSPWQTTTNEARTPKMLVTNYQTTRCHIPKDCNPRCHRGWDIQIWHPELCSLSTKTNCNLQFILHRPGSKGDRQYFVIVRQQGLIQGGATVTVAPGSPQHRNKIHIHYWHIRFSTKSLSICLLIKRSKGRENKKNYHNQNLFLIGASTTENSALVDRGPVSP
jgi:hypothetical protein